MKTKILNNMYEIINYEKINSDKEIRGIVIVGSSGAGKTTLVNALRNDSRFTIPQRVITRPRRQNDDLTENDHSTKEGLINMRDLGKISLHWKRKMEGNRVEDYAFKKIERNKFVIFSGNNALYNNKESIWPINFLDNFIYVGIYSSDSDRENRLRERSPDLFQGEAREVKYRLSDVSDNIKNNVDVLFINSGSLEKSVDSFKQMVNSFL